MVAMVPALYLSDARKVTRAALDAPAGMLKWRPGAVTLSDGVPRRDAEALPLQPHLFDRGLAPGPQPLVDVWLDPCDAFPEGIHLLTAAAHVRHVEAWPLHLDGWRAVKVLEARAGSSYIKVGAWLSGAVRKVG